MPEEKTTTSHRSAIHPLLIVVLIAAVVGFGWTLYSYQSVKNRAAAIQTEEGLASFLEEANREILEKIGRHIALPEDQDPFIASVQDAAALRESQPFFSLVEDGDVVVVYENQAIIYRDAIDKLVNVGEVTYSDDTANLEDQLPGIEQNETEEESIEEVEATSTKILEENVNETEEVEATEEEL